jgi:hypothetical protein
MIYDLDSQRKKISHSLFVGNRKKVNIYLKKLLQKLAFIPSKAKLEIFRVEVFLIVTPYSVVVGHQLFRGLYCEDGGSIEL